MTVTAGAGLAGGGSGTTLTLGRMHARAASAVAERTPVGGAERSRPSRWSCSRANPILRFGAERFAARAAEVDGVLGPDLSGNPSGRGCLSSAPARFYGADARSSAIL